MVFQQLSDLYQKIGSNNRYGVEDVCDRLNLYTVILFALAALVVGVKQYILNEISCYIPVSPSGEKFKEFVNDYCWVRGTIPMFPDEQLPNTPELWQEYDETRRISYYQWVPFLLGIQCIIFYLPHLAWQMVCTRLAGGDLFGLMKEAANAGLFERDLRKNQIKRVVEFIEDVLFFEQKNKNKKRHFIGELQRRWHRGRLQYCYLVYKISIIMNAAFQLYFIQLFLGLYDEGNYGKNSLTLGHNRKNNQLIETSMYGDRFGLQFGLALVHHLRTGRDWRQTILFPRVAYCLIPAIQGVGQEQAYTAQCALPVNMLNEKIYIFFWFWIVGLFFVTSINLFCWIVWANIQKLHSRNVLRFLRIKLPTDVEEKKLAMKRFVDRILNVDGVFVIQMLTLNAGEIVTSEVVEAFYKSNFVDMEQSDTSSFDEHDLKSSIHPVVNDRPPSYV